MRVLVVGASGFVGRHLIPHLESCGHTVESWSRSGSQGPGVDLLGPEPLPKGQWDAAFHLAGHSRPSLGWSSALTAENIAMTARLLDHLAETSPGCRFIFPSSAHVYADSVEPHAETDEVSPSGPYGLSKQLCEASVQSHAKNLKVVIVRAFNKIGPGLPEGLLVTDLMNRIRGGEDPLRMSGRNALRDFLDVRDAVQAYERLACADVPSGSVFNLCSGTPLRVSALIQSILSHLGIHRQVIFEDLREDILTGHCGKLKEAIGWSPSYPLEDTLGYMLEAARA